MASKIFPVPSLIPPALPTPSGEAHPRSQSTDPGGQPSSFDKDGAYNVRSVPVRIYLPDGPVLQDIMQPLNESGSFVFLYSLFLRPSFHVACRVSSSVLFQGSLMSFTYDRAVGSDGRFMSVCSPSAKGSGSSIQQETVPKNFLFFSS